MSFLTGLFGLLGYVIAFAYWMTILYGIAFLIRGWLFGEKPLIQDSIGHWAQSIPGLSVSPREFYGEVEQRVRAYGFPGVKTQVVAWRQGGPFSEKREYLRMEREGAVFDLCIAPFGNTVFISEWTALRPNKFLKFLFGIPVFGMLAVVIVHFWDPITYYKMDAAGMFQSAVHPVVLEVLDEKTKQASIAPIPAEERKPVLRDLYVSKVRA